ncbi:hypothetical protein F4774DRAFT_413021 [Daldinia eschscholtzii]|nr:hypothetical protein F4774DRAFT_413021 [Daldinia eschscholtzii]
MDSEPDQQQPLGSSPPVPTSDFSQPQSTKIVAWLDSDNPDAPDSVKSYGTFTLSISTTEGFEKYGCYGGSHLGFQLNILSPNGVTMVLDGKPPDWVRKRIDIIISAENVDILVDFDITYLERSDDWVDHRGPQKDMVEMMITMLPQNPISDLALDPEAEKGSLTHAGDECIAAGRMCLDMTWPILEDQDVVFLIGVEPHNATIHVM